MRSWPSCVLWASGTASRCGGLKWWNQARPDNKPKVEQRPGEFLSGALLLGYTGKPAPAVTRGYPHSPPSTHFDGPAGAAPRRLLQSQGQHQISSSDGPLHARNTSSHVEAGLPVLLRAQQKMAEEFSSDRQLSIVDSGAQAQRQSGSASGPERTEPTRHHEAGIGKSTNRLYPQLSNHLCAAGMAPRQGSNRHDQLTPARAHR